MRDLDMSENRFGNARRKPISNQRQMVKAPHHILVILRIPHALSKGALGKSVPGRFGKFGGERISVANATRMETIKWHVRHSRPRKHLWKNQLVNVFNNRIFHREMTH